MANPGLAQRLAGALLLLPALAAAQNVPETDEDAARQYAVEIILFRYADSVSAGTEIFVPDPPPEPEEEPDELELGIDPDAPVPEFGDLTPAPEEPVALDPDGRPILVDEDGNQYVEDADGNRLLVDAEGIPLRDEDGNLVVVREPLPPRADYLLMLEDELTLGTTWDQLERLGAYEPFAHFGWTQSLSPYDEPIAINVDQLMPPAPGFAGEFTLYLSRFLHLVVNLEQNANPDIVALEEDPFFTYGDERFVEPLPYEYYGTADTPTFYRINEDRIFKSGDLRYFDHPRFGVLAKIERVVEPDPEEEPEAEPLVAPAAPAQSALP